MSSWNGLDQSGQVLILETIYKDLFGFSNKNTGSNLSSEIQDFLPPTVYGNKIFVQDIPTSAPKDSTLGAAINFDTTDISASKQTPIGTLSYVARYNNVLLSNKTLGSGVCYRFQRILIVLQEKSKRIVIKLEIRLFLLRIIHGTEL